LPGFAAKGTRIHRQSAANGSWYARHELNSTKSMAISKTGQTSTGYAGLDKDFTLAITLNLGKSPMSSDHSTVKTSVADQQVTAQAHP
jgi:hypothetical protein